MVVVRHRMLSRVLTLLLLTTPLSSALQAESRFFVSTVGSLIEAEIVSAAGDNVTLRKKDDGRVLNVRRSTLCKEDHAFIDAWLAVHPEAAASAPVQPPVVPATGGPKFSLSSTIRSAKSSRGGSEGSYRTIDISYNILLQSREVKRDLNGAKATIFTFGRSASTEDDRLYVMQKIEFDLNLRAQGKFEQSTPEVRLSYYQGSNYRDGAKEYGFLFIVTDAAGVIQHVDGVPAGIEKHASTAIAFTPPCVIDRDFRVLPNAAFHSSIELVR